MFEIYHFSQNEIMAFFLVFARVASFLAVWPVLSMANVPMPIKILFSLAVAGVFFPLVAWKSSQSDFETFYFFILMKEITVGVAMGFLARMFFFGIEGFGNMVSDSLGLGSAQVFNPLSDSRSSVVEQFYLALATMFYLLINGHHHFVAALFRSFELFPINKTGINLLAFSGSGELLQAVVLMGLKLSAPVIVSLFAINVAMGVMGRAVPQMNVLVTSLSVNVLVGLGIMVVAMPAELDSLPGFLNDTIENLFRMIRAF